MSARRNKYWTAAVTRYCEETRATHHVERQGFDFCLPYIQERGPRGWQRALMFPGYILVELTPEWRVLSSTKGIARLLLCGDGADRAPMRIHASHVQALRAREDSRGFVQLHPRFAVGESATTYNGFKGVVQEMLPHDRCRLLMSIMGRHVQGEFDTRELVRAA